MSFIPISNRARKVSARPGARVSPRVALFTPLPPAKTGTADYGFALASELAKLVELEVFDKVPRRFDPRAFDLVVYQISNNPHHAPFYDLALKCPGVVVLHEVNLHHLIQSITLKGASQQAYLREVVYEIFGHDSLDLANDQQGLRVPQSHHFTMARRLLERSTACIVHSEYAIGQVRLKGFRNPIVAIPHGTSVRHLDATKYRQALGIGSGDPLIGIFGFQRPDKKVDECLLTIRKLLEYVPRAKLLILGEAHAEIALKETIRVLGLQDAVLSLGFQDLEDFDGYLASCDIILNLRQPTFGETSGTMMRAFGLGKAVIVSENGASIELPDEICVKLPCDQFENDMLLECLKWLTSDLAIPREIGRRARQWALDTCTWQKVARSYYSFLTSLLTGGDHVSKFNGRSDDSGNLAACKPACCDREAVSRYLTGWVKPDSDSESYLQQHSFRLAKTLELTPPGIGDARILEMGCYGQITPALRDLLGYREVRGCYLGLRGETSHARRRSKDGELFECVIDLFNAEVDTFPYSSNYFNTVLCCELLGHLEKDPMHMMTEIHRILQPNGVLIVTTPNAVSRRAVAAALRANQPIPYSYPMKPSNGSTDEARHGREYTPKEIRQLLQDSGFAANLVETGPYTREEDEAEGWVSSLLKEHRLPTELRGDCVYAIGRKEPAVRNRYPSWLYHK